MYVCMYVRIFTYLQGEGKQPRDSNRCHLMWWPTTRPPSNVCEILLEPQWTHCIPTKMAYQPYGSVHHCTFICHRPYVFNIDRRCPIKQRAYPIIIPVFSSHNKITWYVYLYLYLYLYYPILIQLLSNETWHCVFEYSSHLNYHPNYPIRIPLTIISSSQYYPTKWLSRCYPMILALSFHHYPIKPHDNIYSCIYIYR